MSSSNPTQPIPIPPPTPPTSKLIQLLKSQQWQLLYERLTSHPEEVGSSPQFRNERGYTILHCLIAYNRGMAGEELGVVAQKILRAAEAIDWGSEYVLDDGEENVDRETGANVNEVQENGQEGPRRTGGAWRLLMDQKNHAQWSPLHLVFVQGGVSFGKVPLARALLQMNAEQEYDTEEDRQKGQAALQLLDRQNRSMLHHNCETIAMRDDNVDSAHFLIAQCPSMLFVRDSRGNAPYDHVLKRLITGHAVNRRGVALRGEHGEDCRKGYRMLKLLVSGMEREERRIASGAEHNEDATNAVVQTAEISAVAENRLENGEAVDTTEVNVENPSINTGLGNSQQTKSGIAAAMQNLQHDDQPTAITNNDIMTPSNILHLACRLSKSACPSDGSLLSYLASSNASKLEYGADSEKNLAEEADDNGNYALHIFLSNESYATSAGDCDKTKNKKTPSHDSVEYTIVRDLIAAYPPAISIANNNEMLPLTLAMQSGLRNVIALLVDEYPEAVLMDPKLEDVKIFTEVLISLSLSLRERKSDNKTKERDGEEEDTSAKEECKLLSSAYFLVRSCPDVVAFDRVETSEESTKIQVDKKSSNLFRRLKFWKR